MKRAAFLSFDWDHEVMSAYYEGMQACLDDRGSTALFIFNAYGEHEGLDAGVWALDLFSLCDLEGYDGFLIQGNRTWQPSERQYLIEKMRDLGKPVVSVSYQIDGAHYVGTDNYQAEFDLVHRVLEDRRCMRPAFVNGLETSAEARDRLRGFTDACSDFGIHNPVVYQAGWNKTDGIVTALRMLDDRANLPDAIICCNDVLAIGVQETLQQHGVKVPDEVLITGFDNYDMVLKATPHITTVDRDYRSVGYAAMDTLISLMEGEEHPACIAAPMRLVLSESTGHAFDRNEMESWANGMFDMEMALRSFLKLLARMQPALLAARTLGEIMDACERFFSKITSSNIRLLLNDAYLQGEAFVKYVPYGETMSLMACGGDGFVGTRDGEHVYARIPAREVTSFQLGDKPTSYMVLPIRHEAACAARGGHRCCHNGLHSE